jgi:pimeloyl-[acyl-carrier protein] methyl ester esterase
LTQLASGMSSIEILAYHGWGFDKTCWRSWQAQATQQGDRFGASDRGYFGHPVTLKWENQDAARVILAHSFGLHLCPVAQLQQADLLVIFGGFFEFHPAQAGLRRRSQRILHQMLNQFKIQPEVVLNAFKANCYYPLTDQLTQELPDAYDFAVLTQDLERLDTSMIKIEILQEIPQILILHGKQDQIVSPQQGQNLRQQLPNSQLIEMLDAGHALPFTHFQTCWSVLQAAHASYFS